MSIRPIAYDEAAKTYTMLHDDPGYGHTFEVGLAELQHSLGVDGTPAWETIVVPCKLDDSVSCHPVSGGAAPLEVQTMAAKLVELSNCPCGTLAELSSDVALAHSKLHCAQMDGLDRWQVEDNSGPAINVLVNTTNSYICGLGPIQPGDLPPSYTTESTLTVLGAEILDVILHNTYAKLVNGKAVRAEKPNAAGNP